MSGHLDDDGNYVRKFSQAKISRTAILKRRDRRTRLKIENIPQYYTESMVLDELNKRHDGRFDDFHLLGKDDEVHK